MALTRLSAGNKAGLVLFLTSDRLRAMLFARQADPDYQRPPIVIRTKSGLADQNKVVG
jgi:hypothetical protein